VQSRHYSGTWPAAARRYGLFDLAGGLLGVCVLGIPMSAAVLTNVFSDLEPMVEALELSRLVLADEVPGNAETWFIARVFADAAAAAGVRGVVAFADPVPRVIDGRLVFPGHRGAVYIAKGGAYLRRATPRTLTVLGDGRVLSDRSAQKVRQDERGHEHVERQLVRLGADPRRATQPGAQWLAEALGQVRATRLRHRGNHRYAFRLGRTARERARVRIARPSGPYPAAVDAVPPAQLGLLGGTVVTAFQPSLFATCALPGCTSPVVTWGDVCSGCQVAFNDYLRPGRPDQLVPTEHDIEQRDLDVAAG